MVKKTINILIAIPLAAIILLVSSGATIFLHHCSCQGKTIFSFTHQVGCGMESNASVNHNILFGDNIQIRSDNDSCGCSNENITIKLNNATTAITFTFNIDKVSIHTIIPVVLPYDSHQTLSNTTESYYSESESPPPKAWGKNMLICYNSLKTSDILS